MFVCTELADDGTVEAMSQGKAVAVRFGIMALVVLVAALAFDVLGSVESIVGAVCSMTSSMLLPAFFFLRYVCNLEVVKAVRLETHATV